jgi:hypothetical protein
MKGREGPVTSADPDGMILDRNGCKRQSECSDGIDNEPDGATDYPDDPSCESIVDDQEDNPDQDGDSVQDGDDQCEGTGQPGRVDAVGCPLSLCEFTDSVGTTNYDWYLILGGDGTISDTPAASTSTVYGGSPVEGSFNPQGDVLMLATNPSVSGTCSSPTDMAKVVATCSTGSCAGTMYTYKDGDDPYSDTECASYAWSVTALNCEISNPPSE